MKLLDTILLSLTKHECNRVTIGDYWKAKIEGKLSVLKLVPFVPDSVAIQALERLSMAYIERSELPEIKTARQTAETQHRLAVNYNIFVSIANVLAVKDSPELRQYLIENHVPCEGASRNDTLERLITRIKEEALRINSMKPKTQHKKSTMSDHLSELNTLRKFGYKVSRYTLMDEYIEAQNDLYKEIQQQKAAQTKHR